MCSSTLNKVLQDVVSVDSIAHMHRLLGVIPPQHPLVSIVDLSLVSVPSDLINKRLAVGLYSITMKTKFAAPFLYGRDYFDFESGTLFACAPGQVIVSENAYEKGDIEGWSIYIHPDFLLGETLKDRMSQYDFFGYDIKEALHVSDSERAALKTVVEQLENELASSIDDYSRRYSAC